MNTLDLWELDACFLDSKEQSFLFVKYQHTVKRNISKKVLKIKIRQVRSFVLQGVDFLAATSSRLNQNLQIDRRNWKTQFDSLSMIIYFLKTFYYPLLVKKKNLSCFIILNWNGNFIFEKFFGGLWIKRSRVLRSSLLYSRKAD
jgi:hypothetical protein